MCVCSFFVHATDDWLHWELALEIVLLCCLCRLDIIQDWFLLLQHCRHLQFIDVIRVQLDNSDCNSNEEFFQWVAGIMYNYCLWCYLLTGLLWLCTGSKIVHNKPWFSICKVAHVVVNSVSMKEIFTTQKCTKNELYRHFK